MSGKDLSNQSHRKIGSIEIKEKSYPLDSLFEVEQDLNKAYMEQASLYAFFVTKMVEAEHDYNLASQEKDLVYAEADTFYRQNLKNLHQKITESQIKSAIIQDLKYGDALQGESEAKYHFSMLKQIVNAMEIRSKMLISLGAHRRAEFEMTNMNIRKREIEDVKTSLRKRAKNRKQSS